MELMGSLFIIYLTDLKMKYNGMRLLILGIYLLFSSRCVDKKKEIKQDLLLCAYIEKNVKNMHKLVNHNRLVDAMSEPCVCNISDTLNNIVLQLNTTYGIPKEIYEIKNINEIVLIGYYGKVPEWDKFTNYGFKKIVLEQFHNIDKSRKINLYGDKLNNLDKLHIYNSDTIILAENINFSELNLSGRGCIKLKGRIFKNTKKIDINIGNCIDDIDFSCFPKLNELVIQVPDSCSIYSKQTRDKLLKVFNEHKNIKKLKYNKISLVR